MKDFFCSNSILNRSFYFHRNLQEHPFTYDSNTITEPFFIVNGFWNLPGVKCKYHHIRSSVGFQRSSPRYFYQNLRKVSESYFQGTFSDPNMRRLLTAIERESVKGLEIEDIVERHLRKDYYTQFLLSCLHAYIHSPIQTKGARIPIGDEASEIAFRNIANKLKIQFFVQKVDFNVLNRWPRTAIVSCFFIYRNYKTGLYIQLYSIAKREWSCVYLFLNRGHISYAH